MRMQGKGSGENTRAGGARGQFVYRHPPLPETVQLKQDVAVGDRKSARPFSKTIWQYGLEALEF